MRTFLVLATSICAQAQTFNTGAPELVMPRHGIAPATPAQYEKFAAAARGSGLIVAINKLPQKLSPDYRLGYNFIYEHRNHGWILDRDAQGFMLFLDLKGDGDLSQAAPIRFARMGSAESIEIPMEDSQSHWLVRFELAQERSSATGRDETVVKVADSARRRGHVELNGLRIPFELSGSSGRYENVGFDRANTGKFDRYKAADGWVNLAGKTYAFQFDLSGSALTLHEREALADRPSLQKNTLVPDLSFPDLEGNVRSLRKGISDLTLVEFWFTGCGPCREEMPELKKLFEETPRARFTIMGISNDESLEDLHRYLKEFSIAWPECLEPVDGPIHRSLRVEAFPTYFLLSRNGTIVDQWANSGEAVKRVRAALAKEN